METFRGSRADLVAMLRQIPAALAGGPDPFGLARGLQLRMGVACLSQIQLAFLAKARGGTGSDGIKWPPLKRSTIAQRRTTAGERKALGISGKRTRGLLTEAQNKRWKQIFASRLAKLRLMMSEGAAKARAAQIAWAVLKSEGAKTKLDVLGGRTVEIGRDSGVMFRSLTPGVEDRPSGQADQIFQVGPGSVIVGSNVPYFVPFHKRRPVWPADGRLPPPWADAIRDALRQGLVLVVARLAQRGRR